MNLPFIIPEADTCDLAILREIARKHGISPRDMLGDSRFMEVRVARFEAFHRMQMELGWPLTRIGALFDKHHTTVLHGIRMHRGLPRPGMRKPVRVITVGDVALPVYAWARRNGLRPTTVYARLMRGWNEKRAVTEPPSMAP